jgi:hypothetical protein
MTTLDHELQMLRREAILQVLYDFYPLEQSVSLILGAIAPDRPDLQLDYEATRRAIIYEGDLGHLLYRTNTHAVMLARLLPDGVEMMEAMPTFDPLRREQLRMLRLRVLCALNALQGQLLTERLVRAYLRDDTDLDLSHPNLPRAQHYLAQRGLIQFDSNRGLARILPPGIDYLVNPNACIASIARPVVI